MFIFLVNHLKMPLKSDAGCLFVPLLHHLLHHRMSCLVKSLLNVCGLDIMQPRRNAGEEARGPQRRPGERGGLSQRAGRPADGIINTKSHFFSLIYPLASKGPKAILIQNWCTNMQCSLA